MTVTHGTPQASIRSAISREKRKVHARERHHVVKFNRDVLNQVIRNPKAYAAAIKADTKGKIRKLLGDEYRPTPTWKKTIAKKKVTLPKITLSQPAFIDEYQKAEDRMKERAKKAVEMLCFGIEELSIAQSAKKTRLNAQQINIGFMINVVQNLCTYARIPAPEISGLRISGITGNRKCLDCGASLSPNESGDLCSDCKPDTSTIKALSEQRRQQERDELRATREIKKLRKQLKQMEKGLR